MSYKNFTAKLALMSVVALLSTMAMAQYKIINLDSNQIKAAKNADPLAVNGWGLARSATSPWWVANQGSGWSTLYDGMGTKQSLVVSVPPAEKLFVGQPTGVVYNGTTEDFKVNGSAAIFIFDTLDGTISAWSPVVDLKSATVIADNSGNGASYTGLAITNRPSGNSLFAVDNANNKIEIYDANFTSTGTFAADPAVPSGMAAFGIRDINGIVFVAFAPTNEGPGGYIDMYKEDGTLIGPFTKGLPLNQPWGFAVAPRNFGRLSNALLISNNNDRGTIVAYDANGKFVGFLRDERGRRIVIDQLWAIDFGGGTVNNGAANALFFTAGPADNLAGTFGVIVPRHFK
ncbi:MAG TPA: TIGR03118 family protein [Terriglobales bacterium]|jgi:uncharacterized protein (TIGR03118 family)